MKTFDQADKLKFQAHAEALGEDTHMVVMVEITKGDGWKITPYGTPAALLLLHHRLGRFINQLYNGLDMAYPPHTHDPLKPRLAPIEGGEP